MSSVPGVGITTPAGLAAAIEQAATALASDPASAERQIRQVLSIAPRDPRAMLILASARRRQGDPDEALSLLEPLAKAFPRAANTYYELGAVLADLKHNAPAVLALRHALSINPELPEAWRTLGDLLFLAGDVAGGQNAYAEHERTSVRDPRLRPAADALFAGRLDAAAQTLHTHLRSFPSDVAALNLLAETYLRQGGFGEAEVLLASVLKADPRFDGARFTYATALFRQQKAVEALPHVERLLAAQPAHPAYRNLMAACLGLIGQDEAAGKIHESLVTDYPLQPRIWLNYGHALRTVGRRDDAVAAYRRCIALAPEVGDAYWGLANLKVASFTEADTAAMQAQLQRPDLSDEDRLHFHYALGKALEDRGDAAAAFAHYTQGAGIWRPKTGYSAAQITAQTQRSKALFTKDFFAERAGWGVSSDEPIFIVGLPRAGSTLIEQILASHSEVEGTMELPDIGFIAKRLGPPLDNPSAPAYPEALSLVDAAGAAELGQGFLDATRLHRRLGRRFFIDKMPNNFQYIGLIHLILPQAKIIDARRHPMGSCFSAFKQHFAQGQSFSYDLSDLGRYYRDYVDLMAHFDATLPGRVHRVIYEDMVEDTEHQVRRLLDYCGLPFEAQCLEFYKNDRAVRTVSSEQVRRPIFRDGLDQWRRFEPWLDPLKQALGPTLEHWRGDA